MPFYHPDTLIVFNKINRSKYAAVPLYKLLNNLTDGTHYTPTYTNEGIKFVSVTNVTENEIDFSNTKYISLEEHKKLIKRCAPKAGDILLTKIGSIGRAAVVPENFPEFSLFVSVALLQPNDSIVPEYLCAYLNSQLSKKQFERHLKGIGVPDLHLESIAQTQIIVPSSPKQSELALNYTKACNSRKRVLAQAEDLLTGINNYLLERLNLSFDDKQHILFYAQKYSEIRSRIDADFYSPCFAHFRKQIEDSSYPIVQIGEICKSISSGFAAGKQDQADDLPDNERVPQLRPFSITPYGQISFATKKYVPISRLQEKDYCNKGEVLFNNTNSAEWVGKSAVFDIDTPCAASNHITRITLKEGINSYYIAAFFNMLRSIGYWKLLSTYFNNQAGVNTETLKTVRILLPEKSIQDEIAEEILRRKNTAEALRIEAEQDWEAAKAEFERKLLGE